MLVNEDNPTKKAMLVTFAIMVVHSYLLNMFVLSGEENVNKNVVLKIHAEN